MAGPADPDEGLSPAVRELVDRVRARASESAGTAEIRALAAEAAQHAEGNVRTLAEIRDLYGVALRRAERISGLMAQLAGLAEDEEDR